MMKTKKPSLVRLEFVESASSVTLELEVDGASVKLIEVMSPKAMRGLTATIASPADLLRRAGEEQHLFGSKTEFVRRAIQSHEERIQDEVNALRRSARRLVILQHAREAGLAALRQIDPPSGSAPVRPRA